MTLGRKELDKSGNVYEREDLVYKRRRTSEWIERVHLKKRKTRDQKDCQRVYRNSIP